MDSDFKKPQRRILKTYSHLADAKRIPSPYEIATTQLLYYPTKGFAVKNPVTDWFQRTQTAGEIKVGDLSRFSDPKTYTYTTYVQERRTQELHIQKVLSSVDFKQLSSQSEILQLLENSFVPLLYPLHGMQMAAAYIGQIVPESRICICAAFQTADEMRRIHHIAFLTSLIRESFPEFGENRKELWENHAQWQPLRQVIEELLVTYAWTESLVVLNRFIKPLIQQIYFEALFNKISALGMPQLLLFTHSVAEQEQWHSEWYQALWALLAQENAQNQNEMERLSLKWRQKLLSIVQAAPFLSSQTLATLQTFVSQEGPRQTETQGIAA